ncbi:hypothetical protein HYC85_019396 [Camellia sinensis]|uniref:Survival protein SurE-like phosphatase/nucleotidase domain-containing protein n=1 Tax=Camellia sinensis TaxID=4442 RepID=A0A7J7GQP3_CAMSI|nr:hypothetical protein HYC85_019396 [Camellia sinensis]
MDCGADAGNRPTVTVTNDDGIDAPGLRVLVRVLVSVNRYEVLVCAPDSYVKGLYRDATSSFLGAAFESSIIFGIYSQIKQSLESLIIIPSATIDGGIISSVLCPSELVKCRTQVLGIDYLVPKSSRYNGPLDCALKTIKTEGESIRNAVFFSSYESVRYYMYLQLRDASFNQNNLTDVGVGIMTGFSGITVSFFYNYF